MTSKRILPMFAIAVALVGAGCGDDGDEQEASATPTATQTAAATPAPLTADTLPEISDDLDKEPEVPQIDAAPPEDLVVKDIVKGKGKKAKPGDTLSVQYTGYALSNGQKFDASWDRGQPLEFHVGAGQVIPGWDQGIPGMREGGRRVLAIPGDLAYGPNGSPPVIGPDETLIFVVDLEQVG
jgi:peptidylprolyl isomerase